VKSILEDFRITKDYDIYANGIGEKSFSHKALVVQIEVKVFLEPGDLYEVVENKMLEQAERIGR
jgi:hypothetical protein